MPIHSQKDERSRIWLLINEEEKLGQVIRQTEKLVDVLSIKHSDVNDSVFTHMEDYFRE
jgi:acetolactate synthase-1/3 small subunit